MRAHACVYLHVCVHVCVCMRACTCGRGQWATRSRDTGWAWQPSGQGLTRAYCEPRLPVTTRGLMTHGPSLGAKARILGSDMELRVCYF